MNVNITGIYDNTVVVDSNLFEDVKSVHIAPAYLRGGESAFAYVIREDGRFGQNGEKE